ncbi:MAG: hypothetical protein CBE00_09285 [Planctomycetaceae bacterium TMED240]|nr:MAG: hypothetical protein CBE00_09285 [Planctomycetaceae bacterium TMED240]
MPIWCLDDEWPLIEDNGGRDISATRLARVLGFARRWMPASNLKLLQVLRCFKVECYVPFHRRCRNLPGRGLPVPGLPVPGLPVPGCWSVGQQGGP